jgi:dipeptidyl aminopeptidase/acylaminoacyl peptidase
VSDADQIDDHVAAIKQLAQTRPWMDLDRVGVTGHSAGGYGSMKAMLLRPDFFKVCVSSSGNHDDRMNHAWWGEKFYGLVHEFDYEQHANATHAARLEGKLLLIHGEMDDNAVPHHTLRLADALMAADKDFEVILLNNADHGFSSHSAYFFRRRFDFLVRHLMGVDPAELD